MNQTFKVNDRVAQRYQPDAHGTVSRVTEKGFRVTWDSLYRPKGVRRVIPRNRLWYPWGQSFYFHRVINAKETANDQAGIQSERNQPRVFSNSGRKAGNGALPEQRKGKAAGGSSKGTGRPVSKGTGTAPGKR